MNKNLLLSGFLLVSPAVSKAESVSSTDDKPNWYKVCAITLERETAEDPIFSQEVAEKGGIEEVLSILYNIFPEVRSWRWISQNFSPSRGRSNAMLGCYNGS